MSLRSMAKEAGLGWARLRHVIDAIGKVPRRESGGNDRAAATG